ncbi:matrilin-3-like [Branchiostoma floridae]|uniref:Matrilin-3-like n=1 Tax=Branchiostoma floridae TaxID=7739 RepID=A0A9J7MYD3_BRAFL|nr:matrilin-3-like [Branchiostoma floridae]XP_035684606.1 matrilin-3-like [Branchiostoma floridae]
MWSKEMLAVACLLLAAICKANAQCSFDVVFLADSSSSVRPHGTTAANIYIRDAIDCLTMYNVYDVGVGVTHFTCTSTEHIPLGHYTLGDPELTAAVGNIAHTGGLSRIGLAIRKMKDTTSFRSGVPRVAVVLTDGVGQGDANERVDDYAEQAEEAREAGITLYAVATGMYAFLDTAALDTIAGDPSRLHTTHFGGNGCGLAAKLVEDICETG